MTEGIVQKIIKKFNNEHGLFQQHHEWVISKTDMDKLQQELIEEIKKTCDISDLDDDAYWVIRQIIGDNTIKEIEKQGMKNEKEQSEKLWRRYE